ncbi:hypothetical protein BGZ73_007240 [Actinomortierella ambigua]|nr:hypothetical protein BGZ73_007240 [Actinomortierella ambigua]
MQTSQAMRSRATQLTRALTQRTTKPIITLHRSIGTERPHFFSGSNRHMRDQIRQQQQLAQNGNGSSSSNSAAAAAEALEDKTRKALMDKLGTHSKPTVAGK